MAAKDKRLNGSDISAFMHTKLEKIAETTEILLICMQTNTSTIRW